MALERLVSESRNAATADGDDNPPAASRGVWFILVLLVLIVAAAAAAFAPVWNSDIHWHLASGKWMFEHGRILGHDPFSINGTKEWINVHWLFQLIVTALHAVGGFTLLTVMKSLLSVAITLAMVLALRKRVSPAWMIFCVVAMLLVSSGRIRVRPEAFTLLFLMLVIILLESVRLGASTRRLWWLVPIMLLWVNMHGLYILGPALMWSALIGALIDRRLRRNLFGRLLDREALMAILAAHVVCLLTPWPFQAATHPLLLWTRISGEAVYYTYGVAELRPTWGALHLYWKGAVLAVMAAMAMRINFRRLPIGHVGWLLGFAAMGLMARRNVGLAGPIFAYLLAWHGTAVWRKLAEKFPRAAHLRAAAMAIMLIAAVAFIAATSTEWMYRKMGMARRFGAGLQRDNYPLAAAKFLRDLPAKGDIHCLNFGDSSVFDYHTFPSRRVYMDGRLEAHSLKRFIRQHRMFYDLRFVGSAGRAKIDDSVRFFIIRNNLSQQLQTLMESPRFRLVFLDPVAACFARTDYAATIDTEPMPPLNLDDFDRQLLPEGTIRNLPPRSRPWYRQNERSKYYLLGRYFLNLGGRDVKTSRGPASDLQIRFTVMGIRHLLAAGTEGIIPPEAASGMIAQGYQQLARYRDIVPSDVLPIDIYTARALKLYDDIDLAKLTDARIRRFALERVRTMLQGRQLDAANAATAGFLENLSGAQRVNPPQQYQELVNIVATEMESARARLLDVPLESLSPLERARRLTAKGAGMIDQAAGLLKNIPTRTPETELLLGDLLLRKGRCEQARGYYRRAGAGGIAASEIDLRLALCDWVKGDLLAASEKLSAAVKASKTGGGAAERFYLALVLEVLGRYDEARDAIATAQSDDQALSGLIEQVRRNLEQR